MHRFHTHTLLHASLSKALNQLPRLKLSWTELVCVVMCVFLYFLSKWLWHSCVVAESKRFRSCKNYDEDAPDDASQDDGDYVIFVVTQLMFLYELFFVIARCCHILCILCQCAKIQKGIKFTLFVMLNCDCKFTLYANDVLSWVENCRLSDRNCIAADTRVSNRNRPQ